MVKPARANSCTVASWSEPFGMPSFSVMAKPSRRRKISPSPCPGSRARRGRSFKRARKTGPFARMAHIPVTEPPDLDEHRVVVAIDAELDDREPVARGLALDPQRVARAAEKGGEAGAPGQLQRLLVHEADHEDLRALRVLDDGGNQPVEFREIHRSASPGRNPPQKEKTPRRSWNGAGLPASEGF